MYKIEKHDEYLLVKFEENFDYNVIQTVIHHITSMKEYPMTNDIWLIGDHHADIRLGELEAMVREFQCRCPRDASRTRTAVVVRHGLTHTLIELWVSATRKRVSFDIRIFHRLDEARMWIAMDESDAIQEQLA